MSAPSTWPTASIPAARPKPFDLKELCDSILRRHALGRYATIVVVAEGATPAPGTIELSDGGVDEFGPFAEFRD